MTLEFSTILQSDDSHIEVKDDAILVAQQGEQDAATATIMASVEQQEGTGAVYYIFTQSTHFLGNSLGSFGHSDFEVSFSRFTCFCIPIQCKSPMSFFHDPQGGVQNIQGKKSLGDVNESQTLI